MHLIISDDVEKDINKINNKLRFYKGEPFDEYDFAAISTSVGKNHVVILNCKYLTDKVFTLGTISHDAFHLSNFICRRVGIKPDVNNDEAQAYLLSWLVEEIYKQYLKYEKI